MRRLSRQVESTTVLIESTECTKHLPEHASLCGTARVMRIRHDGEGSADRLGLAFLEMGQGFSQWSSAFHHPLAVDAFRS